MVLEILPFFSRLFVDEEAEKLKKRFFKGQVTEDQWISFSFVDFLKDSCRMTGTFGDGVAEGVAEVVFLVCATMNSVVGVYETELYTTLADSRGRLRCGSLETQDLIDDGYFRKEKILSRVVLFPTEKAFRRLVWHREQFHKEGVAK